MVSISVGEFDQLETALDAAGMAWWWMELPSGAIFFSPNKTKMLGREAEDFFHYKSFTDLVHPDDYEPMMKAMTDHIEGKAELYETTYRIKASDGTYKQFYDKGKIVMRKGKEISIAGIVMDIGAINKTLLINATPATRKK